MKFESVPPSHYTVHSEFWAGRYAVVRSNYTFGQKRIQVWYKEPHYAFPDVLSIEF